MLIYNYQKEFIGIDESDLEVLGFSSLAELRTESADFADMFIKTPGYVHNFKHVHWIDFITCNEYSDNSKVIIHAQNKNYRCLLDVKTAYLVDNPSKKAYLIHLTNLRELSPAENEQISGDVLERPLPISTTESATILNTHTRVSEPEPFNENELFLDEPGPFSNDTEQPGTVQDDYDLHSNVVVDPYENTTPDTKIDLDFQDNKPPQPKEKLKAKEEGEDFKVDMQEVLQNQKLTQVSSSEIDDVEIDDSYSYDPEVASRELGLPVDLIEEFIQDFISQAKEFKGPIYEALENNDQDNVKILSHKLKGVAANLRIENAFDALATINTSDNYNETRTNLNIFYKIISKLSQEPYEESQVLQKEKEFVIGSDTIEEVAPQESKTQDDDELVLSFKDDEEIQTIENTQNTTELEIEAPEVIEDESPKEMPSQTTQEKLSLDDELLVDTNDLQEPLEFIEDINKDENVDTIVEVRYDKHKIAHEIGIDLESFNELYRDYIFETKVIQEAMKEAINTNEVSKWNAAASKLKGMSEHMRLDLFEEELSTLIKTQDSDEAQRALGSFSKKFEQI